MLNEEIIENTENFKRNPFERIGKVFKYEFIHASKTLIPLYAVLLLLGLLIGLLSNPLSQYTNNIFDEENSFHYEFNYDSRTATPEQNLAIKKSVILVGLTIAFTIFATAIFIITIVVLARRFKKSMMEDEAYLNLTLPVTIGEHLWGRFLSDLAWIFICFLVFTASFSLCLIRNHSLPWITDGLSKLNYMIKENNYSPVLFYFQMALSYLVNSSLIILFVFSINSIAHINPKHQTLTKIISAVVLIIIASKADQLVFRFTGEDLGFIKTMWISTAVNFVLCTGCFGITHFIFTKNLNLE